MTIADGAVPVTGANRGIGLALVEEALSVHAVPIGLGYVDRTRNFDIPKATPESVARTIFDGAERGEEDIFPDPTSESMVESWRTGAGKTLERQNAAFVPAEPVMS
jgi:NAD(P)-dependent dehydrogenase (short-subunit alcohol dehydrogenase family)